MKRIIAAVRASYDIENLNLLSIETSMDVFTQR
jgi:hypothetical protein